MKNIRTSRIFFSVLLLAAPLTQSCHAISLNEGLWAGAFCGVLAYGACKHNLSSDQTLLQNATSVTNRLSGYMTECSLEKCEEFARHVTPFGDEQPLLELTKDFHNAILDAQLLVKTLRCRNCTTTAEYIELNNMLTKAQELYSAIEFSDAYENVLCYQRLCEGSDDSDDQE